MIDRLTRFSTPLAALGFGLCLASAVSAQETPGQMRARAATSSLNGGPAETTLGVRANAAPPLALAERPQPVQTMAPRPAAPPVQAARQPQPDRRSPALQTAPAMAEPEAIALPLGYYVRGDMNCNQVWPGEGNLAWLTPTSFTIDFGGCEPGQFLQTGPGAWRETQSCHTELGGDAGGYDVTYELVGTGTLLRRAQLALDGRVEQDLWAHCETTDVPVEARFKS